MGGEDQGASKVIAWLVYLWNSIRAWWQRKVNGVNWSKIDAGLYVGGAVKELPPLCEAVLDLRTKGRELLPTKAITVMPLRDGDADAVTVFWIDAAVDVVRAYWDAGWQPLIHCEDGVSRSGLVAIAFEMSMRGLTLDQAIDYVRRGRPVISPHPLFIAALERYEKYLRGS